MVLRSIKSSQPLVTFAPSSIASRDFRALAKVVMALESDIPMDGGLQFFVERIATHQTKNG